LNEANRGGVNERDARSVPERGRKSQCWGNFRNIRKNFSQGEKSGGRRIRANESAGYNYNAGNL